MDNERASLFSRSSPPEYGTDEWLRLVVRRVGVVAVIVGVETLTLVVIGLHAWIGWPW